MNPSETKNHLRASLRSGKKQTQEWRNTGEDPDVLNRRESGLTEELCVNVCE